MRRAPSPVAPPLDPSVPCPTMLAASPTRRRFPAPSDARLLFGRNLLDPAAIPTRSGSSLPDSSPDVPKRGSSHPNWTPPRRPQTRSGVFPSPTRARRPQTPLASSLHPAATPPNAVRVFPLRREPDVERPRSRHPAPGRDSPTRSGAPLRREPDVERPRSRHPNAQPRPPTRPGLPLRPRCVPPRSGVVPLVRSISARPTDTSSARVTR
jgi:hypothetical protein